jgi:prophage regulatory protein
MTTTGAAEVLRKGDELVTLRPVTFVGVHEIAQLLGVTRQRVHALTRDPGFPPPIAVLAIGKIWDAHAVTAWNQTRRRRRT